MQYATKDIHNLYTIMNHYCDLSPHVSFADAINKLQKSRHICKIACTGEPPNLGYRNERNFQF